MVDHERMDNKHRDGYMDAEGDGAVIPALPGHLILDFAPNTYLLASSLLHIVVRGSFQHTT